MFVIYFITGRIEKNGGKMNTLRKSIKKEGSESRREWREDNGEKKEGRKM